MSTTPEGRVKRLVKAELKLSNAYAFWPVQSGYGSRTLDCLGCHKGRFFAVETKAEGGELMGQQEWIKQSIQLAGGKVFLINTVDQAEQVWLDLLAWLLLLSGT